MTKHPLKMEENNLSLSFVLSLMFGALDHFLQGPKISSKPAVIEVLNSNYLPFDLCLKSSLSEFLSSFFKGRKTSHQKVSLNCPCLRRSAHYVIYRRVVHITILAALILSITCLRSAEGTKNKFIY